MKLQPDCS